VLVQASGACTQLRAVNVNWSERHVEERMSGFGTDRSHAKKPKTICLVGVGSSWTFGSLVMLHCWKYVNLIKLFSRVHK
jgi:hypothetical protein